MTDLRAFFWQRLHDAVKNRLDVEGRSVVEALKPWDFAALFAWRSAGLAVALLGAAPDAAACAEARGLVAAMAAAVAQFGAAFPLESAAWVVAALDPALESAPSFLTTTSERTMAGYEPVWTAAVAAVCH